MDASTLSALTGALKQVGGTVLGGLIGGPAGAAIAPVIIGALADALGADKTPEAVTKAITDNPDLAGPVVQRVEANQADALRELARAQRTRDVSVGVQYEHYPPDGRNTYGVSISVPLFLGYDYRGDIARSEADYGAAEQQLIATRAFVSSEQSRLRAEYAARQSRYRRLAEVVLPAAERAGRGADVAIQKGGMSLTDYLDTQRSLRAARIETIQARADLARAALMLRLAGDSQ